MPTVTLLEKAYGYFPPEAFEPTLKSLCKGLNVQVKVKGRTPQEWIQVEVNGEDESVALQLLSSEFGLAPNNADDVEKFSVLGGRIVDSGKTTAELCVDVGVFAPVVVYAKIPSESLQAQIADGKKLPLRNLTKLFCLLNYVPLHVKIVDTDLVGRNEVFKAELSERQLNLFTGWLRSSLDRLMLVGAGLSDVEYAVETSRHFRDVIRIESLGWLEHAIVCKLGTEAVGLIPALGRFLRTANLAPFSPKKIKKIVGGPFL